MVPVPARPLGANVTDLPAASVDLCTQASRREKGGAP
jgi:hypothetical protein